MTPLEKILRLYARSQRKFGDDLRAFLESGWVISSPDFFVMGRPVPRSAAPFKDPAKAFPLADCDAWLVWAAAGDMKAILRAIPFPLPWVAFARRGKPLRFHGLESTLRHGLRSFSSSTGVSP